MRRILVTGAGGLLGTPLVAELERRHEVVATDTRDLDVTDAVATRSCLREHRPDTVVHLAAWTDVDGCEADPDRAAAVNVGGTHNVARATCDIGASLLYVSTDYVFPGTRSGARVETEPTAPLSVYGRTKLEGEVEVQRAGGRHQIARCQSIYGAGRRSFVEAILTRARAGEPLRVVTDQFVSPSWAPDLARALVALLESRARGVFHVANAGGCSWYECARAALEIVGLSAVEVQPTTAKEFARPAPRPANSVFDCGRLARVVGHRLPPWREALKCHLSNRVPENERPHGDVA